MRKRDHINADGFVDRIRNEARRSAWYDDEGYNPFGKTRRRHTSQPEDLERRSHDFGDFAIPPIDCIHSENAVITTNQNDSRLAINVTKPIEDDETPSSEPCIHWEKQDAAEV